MNPLTNVKNITKLNEREQALGFKKSWHDQYKDSAWIFLGGLPYDLTEGDVLCVFSQFGEIVNVNLIRDQKTGKSKGFCFLCYENQKSTVLAVDNFNGVKVLGRTIRVDHCANYKAPKEREDDDEITKALHAEGCAPKIPFEVESLATVKREPLETEEKTKIKVEKRKIKNKDRKKKKKSKKETSSSSSNSSSDDEPVKVKKEKFDAGYEKYTLQRKSENEQNETRSYRSLERNNPTTRREESPRNNFGGKHGSRFVAREQPNERISNRGRSRSVERRRNNARSRSRSNERQIHPQQRSNLNDRHRERSRSNNRRKNRSIERRRNPRGRSSSTEGKSYHSKFRERSRSFETKQPINRYDSKGN